jgi:hypothetical protein
MRRILLAEPHGRADDRDRRRARRRRAGPRAPGSLPARRAHDRYARPLTFLGQLALRDARAAVPGTTRGTGLLSLFIGTREHGPEGLQGVQTLYSASPTQLARLSAHPCVRVLHTHAAAQLHRRTAPHGAGGFPAAPQRLRPTLTVPDEFLAAYHFGIAFPKDDRWLSLQERAAWGILAEAHTSMAFAQVLGWSMPLQDDPTLRRCAGQPARLLWQIDSDDTYNIDDDAGSLILAIGARDLRAGRFDRLCGEDQLD